MTTPGPLARTTSKASSPPKSGAFLLNRSSCDGCHSARSSDPAQWLARMRCRGCGEADWGELRCARSACLLLPPLWPQRHAAVCSVELVPHMPTPRHLFKPERHRALELLAPCGHGCTETTMLAHGFSIEMMVELINAGLATVQTERGGRARVRITEAGRRALSDQLAARSSVNGVQAPKRRIASAIPSKAVRPFL